jgi:hypothetical protein
MNIKHYRCKIGKSPESILFRNHGISICIASMSSKKSLQKSITKYLEAKNKWGAPHKKYTTEIDIRINNNGNYCALEHHITGNKRN